MAIMMELERALVLVMLLWIGGHGAKGTIFDVPRTYYYTSLLPMQICQRHAPFI